MQKFAAKMARTMTPDQIVEFWKQRQRAARDAGQPCYEVLIDPVTGETVATAAE